LQVRQLILILISIV